MPVAPKTKAPSRAAARNSVSHLDQLVTSVQISQITASDAYVCFALTRPNHLQVMFAPYDPVKYPDLLAASAASLDRLFELVKTGTENGTLIAGDPQAMTKAIWSMVHGIAAISIAYKTTAILSENNSTENVVSVFMNYLLDGIASKH